MSELAVHSASDARAVRDEHRAHRQIESFFLKIRSELTASREVATLVITHLLPDRPHFLGAVAAMSDLRAVLPKPRSADPHTSALVRSLHACDELDRARFRQPRGVLNYLERRAAGRQVVLLDVGGYFAPCLRPLCEAFSGQILGVVEDTENGHRRYVRDGAVPPCPVYSVARSPLKNPEDYLIGQSIVFSVESLIRMHGNILHGQETCVIGYGKIGRSVANTLSAKSVRTTVFETDPVRAVEAMSHGFSVSRSKERALRRAGVVVCATGNRALEGDDFTHLRSGAYVATVTSSDDELDTSSLSSRYEARSLGPHLSRFAADDHHFYLLNDGNAVNFVHGASVGPFIFLVQAEILAAVAALASGRVLSPGVHEVTNEDRAMIARSWLASFNEV